MLLCRNLLLLCLVLICLVLFPSSIVAEKQKVVEFQGQLTSHVQYAPMDGHYTLIGERYIPQLNIYVPSKSDHLFDFEISADITTYYSYQSEMGHTGVGKVMPYRFWARYRYKQLEVRVGLQKIDFGSSSLLRPLQWFNSMDPRDPMKITNGVFGLLGRYYFMNNANIWLWCLTLNNDLRGMDVLHSNRYLPEFGGRFQYPVPKGELAVTYNHRWVDATSIIPLPQYEDVQEDKIALDGKWDVGVGLWFETTYSFLHRPLSALTNQFAFNLGVDYTFGLGNGLNVACEHMIMSYDERVFGFDNVQNITAMQIGYPIAMFDNLSVMGFYNWENRSVSAFLSYMHSFEKLSLFANVYYNSNSQVSDGGQGIYGGGKSDLQLGKGVGMQLMLVWNH